MAITKNAWIRYKTLDKCFSSRYKKFYIEDLIAECEKVLADLDPEHSGISLRQIRKDIAFMKSSEGWNIELDEIKDGKKLIYRYKDSKFTITNQPMNAMEAEQMRDALFLFQRISGMPQFDWIQEFIPQLEKSFGLNTKVDSIIGFDDNVDLKGRHFIGELYQHILEKNVLEVTYQAFNQTAPSVLSIHPYYLKQYNKRWYLYGWNDEADKLFNLPLDRFVSLRPIKKKYRKNNEIDFNDYFDEIVGVTKEEGQIPTDIILIFNPSFANYIRTKPISPFQKQKTLEDGSLEVRLKLISNKELYALLLSYGSEVKIIKPKQLIDKIQAEYKIALQQYS
jgi:predicted DNA-binding transcriptional regulator YafY